MASWFEDPKQLVRVDKVHEFGPRSLKLQQTVLMHQLDSLFMHRV